MSHYDKDDLKAEINARFAELAQYASKAQVIDKFAEALANYENSVGESEVSHKVKVRDSDGEADYLNNKIAAGTRLSKVVGSLGGAESITLNVDASGLAPTPHDIFSSHHGDIENSISYNPKFLIGASDPGGSYDIQSGMYWRFGRLILGMAEVKHSSVTANGQRVSVTMPYNAATSPVPNWKADITLSTLSPTQIWARLHGGTDEIVMVDSLDSGLTTWNFSNFALHIQVGFMYRREA